MVFSQFIVLGFSKIQLIKKTNFSFSKSINYSKCAIFQKIYVYKCYLFLLTASLNIRCSQLLFYSFSFSVTAAFWVTTFLQGEIFKEIPHTFSFSYDSLVSKSRATKLLPQSTTPSMTWIAIQHRLPLITWK